MEIYEELFDYSLMMGLIFAALFALVFIFSRMYKEE